MLSPMRLHVLFLLCGLCLGWAGCAPKVPMDEEDLAPALPDLSADLREVPDLPMGEVQRGRGSLVALIDAEPSTAAAGAYKVPTAAELQVFREAMSAVMRGEGERAVPLLRQVGYTLTDYVDDKFDPARERRYYVVRERETARRYWGLYVVRIDAAARWQVFLEAPYGVDQSISYIRQQVGRTLLAADVGGALINTVDRCAEGLAAPSCVKCSGACVRCGGQDRYSFPVSDMGAAESSFFQVAHEVVSAGPQRVVISVHGHTDTLSGYVISDGTKERAPAEALVRRFRASYAEATKPLSASVRSCNDGTSQILCGEALLQGRQTNGYMPMCTGATPQGPRRFLHVQQLFDVRRADAQAALGTQTLLARAILLTWP